MRNQSGFTLAELAVAMSIVGIIVAIAVPSWITWLPSYRLKAVTRDLVSNFQKAKVEAVRRNVNVALSFNTTGDPDTYTMFVDDGAGPGGIAGNNERDGEELLLGSFSIPNMVDIDDPTTFTGNATGFNSRGLPGPLGRVTLRSTKDITRDISLSIAGNIRIE